MTLVPPTPPESPLSGSLTDAGGREQTLELTRKNQQLQDQAPELEERATQDASAAYRAERLLALSIGLNEAVTVEAVADVIFREGTAAVDADAASLALVTRGAGGEPEFEVVRIGGFSSDLVERYHRFPLVAGRPMSDAILTLRPVLVGSRDGSPYPTLADVGYEAFAAVPVVHGGKPLAGIGFSYSAPKAFDEQMRTFLATMSHEIRTPINAVLGYTDLLRLRIAGPLTEEQERHLGRIPERARHLLGLIEEVLDLAKIEAGTLHVEIGKGRSGDGVDAALDIVRALAAAKGVTLADRGDGDGAATYAGDEGRVRQILCNLLGNAVKFTNPGGVVSVRCAVVDAPPPGTRLADGTRYVTMSVTDTGVGIVPDQLERVFEPFVQAPAGDHGPYARERGGAGLGLSISRQLAHLMQGEITVESTPGVGSTFTLWLPAV